MTRLILSAIAAIFITFGSARAADDFYQGKTLRLFAGTSAGSGADMYWQLIRQYLGRHIPGNPTIIEENMPAGGGLAATNYVYNVAKKDGTELGLFNRNTLFAPLLGDKTAVFNAERFNWIGTPSIYASNAWIFMVRSDLPFRTLEELRHAPTAPNVGGTGNFNQFVGLIRDVLHVKMNFIPSYSEPELNLAIQRHEIDAFGTGYSTVAATMSNLLDKGTVRVLVQFGHAKPISTFADVPTGASLAQNEEDRELIGLADLGLTLGFPVAAPPDVPIERIATLRAAFHDLMLDPDYLADMKKLSLDFSPQYGDRLQAEIVHMSQTPPTVIERYRRLSNLQGSGKT
jgi:tripartite-type tricarboxylate transporter receptor subunit TctC